MRQPRRLVLTGNGLARDKRGAAIVEMALVLPLLLALLMGVLVYGQYFMLAHSVQQAANDGARAAIVGLNAADRRAVAARAVERSLAAVTGTHSVAVSETSEAITVAVTFTAPPDSFLRSALVPSPTNVIRSRATFELPVD
ncbi:TadE/TadG family type IV pilus assembly protein [Sphingopyxis sp.]|uniref:TadE/TadG family type IV pilus assembly protein n=1 Tax=Sphingopyxis sp. TaxID=1908224 RepID=UPI003D0C60C3